MSDFSLSIASRMAVKDGRMIEYSIVFPNSGNIQKTHRISFCDGSSCHSTHRGHLKIDVDHSRKPVSVSLIGQSVSLDAALGLSGDIVNRRLAESVVEIICSCARLIDAIDLGDNDLTEKLSCKIKIYMLTSIAISKGKGE